MLDVAMLIPSRPTPQTTLRGSRGRLLPPALMLALVMGGVTGCATVGRDFPSERVNEIVLNVSTKADLLAQFGRPYRRGIEDGDSTWTYVHYKIRLLGGQTETRDLYIRFRDEKVYSFTYNADVP